MVQQQPRLPHHSLKELTGKEEITRRQFILWTSRSAVAKHFNNISKRSQGLPQHCPNSVNSISLQLMANKKYKVYDSSFDRFVAKETAKFWNIDILTHKNIFELFTDKAVKELIAAISCP